VWLHICETTSEKLGNPFDCQVFCDVDELASTVIALARQAFSILVGEHRPLRLEHRAADDVLRCNQLDLVALAAELEPHRLGDLRVGLSKRRGEHVARDTGNGQLGCSHRLIHLRWHTRLGSRRDRLRSHRATVAAKAALSARRSPSGY
jgi:hypothetical protein